MRGAGSGTDSCAFQVEDLFSRATASSRDPSLMPRAMLVFAHPDDEVVALGGRFTRLLSVHFVHVTDGAPADERDSAAHGFASREAYREAREQEFAAALSSAGLENVSRECLGYVDQTASFHLKEVTHNLETRIATYKPEVIFTHPYEGGHPDHDACAFAVHHAVRRGGKFAGSRPLILESPFYHLRHNAISTDEFLSTATSSIQHEYVLSSEERLRKRQLLSCFRTQHRTLEQFSTERERYRVAPDYDFTQPPHAPPLFYDHFPWGMKSDTFCRLAREAEALLASQEPRP